MKLRAKFLLSLVVLIAALTSTSLLVVRRTFQRQVRAALANDLRSSAQTFSILQEDHKELLIGSAQLVADAPSLHAMMTSNDPKTVQDASADFVPATRSDIFLITDPQGRVMALHMTGPRPSITVAEEWAKHLDLQGRRQQWCFLAGHLYHIFTEPMYFGTPAPARLLGFLTVGYKVSDSLVQKIADSSDSEVIFFFGNTVAATTLSSEPLSRCRRYAPLLSAGEDWRSPSEIFLGNERYLATSIRLGDGPAPITLVVLKSFEKADYALAGVNQLLLLVGVGATGLGCLLIFGITKKFGRPLEELLAGVRALSHQDFAYPLNIPSEDEFVELTAAFDTMRTSLVSAQKQLLQAQQLATIGRTASSLSHDLRHRLTAILANSEFLVDEKDSARREHWYEGIRFAVRQMTELLDSLLEFARSPYTLNCRFSDLGDLLKDAIREIRLYPQFSGITVTLVAPEPIKAWFDAKRLHRVFFNLVFNACEVVPKDSGEVEMTVTRLVSNVEIRITDNGPGVPSAIRGSLFQPFVSSGKNKGTGLGLAIAQKCCQDHGGRVELEETVSGRTTFKVILPLAGYQDEARSPWESAEVFAKGDPIEECFI